MVLTRASVSRRLSSLTRIRGASDLSRVRLQTARGFWFCTIFASALTFLIGLPQLASTFFHPDRTTRTALAVAGLSVETRALILLALILVATAVCIGAGLFIALRKPGDLMALFVSWMLISVAVSLGTPELHGNLLLTLLQYVREWMAWTSLAIFLLLFPDGHFRPAWGVWVAAGGALGQALGIIGGASIPDIVPSVSTILCVLLGIVGQTQRYRLGSRELRRQTQWVLLGFLVAIAGLIGSQVAQSILGSEVGDGTLGSLLLLTLLLLCVLQIPLSLTVAVLRYRLFDIEVVVNRTLMFVSLSVCSVLLYLAVSEGIVLLLAGRAGVLPSLAAAAAVALLFAPMRYRLQRGINRLMYGRRDEPYAVLSTLGERLESALAVDAVLPAIVDTVMQTLRLPYAAVALVAHGEQVIAAERGEPVAELRTVPLLFGSEQVGVLKVSPRGPNEALSPVDIALLHDLARQAGVAAQGVRLTAELRQSRERIVTGREEERRRLRRDLHDGIGPTLASITLMADAARNLLSVDREGAYAILNDLRAEAQIATGEIRRVVFDLRPPSLDDVGLLGVLMRVSETLSNAGITVDVKLPSRVPTLPAAVEVAAYRVVHEALANVMRHSQATRCTVRLQVDTDLTVMIQDNGRGLQDAPAGMGRMSMAQRAEELGGACTIADATGGGTVVWLSIPLEHELTVCP